MFTIIPAKSFDQSKTRLASVLSLNERASLCRRLLQRTIGLARQVGEVVVVSRDAGVRRVAKQAGAWALVECGLGLNKALQQASTWVTMHSGQTVLILPGDLPLLRLSDLTEIIKAGGQQTPTMVIAPCHRLNGTNALFLRPPDLIEFAFGPESFSKHRQAAQAIGLEPIVYHSLTLAFDLDLPEDWEKLNLQTSVTTYHVILNERSE